MNTRQKEVLSTCRTLLTRNVIWTPQFETLLKEQGIISESMMTDIEVAPDRQAKVQVLLELLPLKGSQAYEKFCDILHLTGHLFLADYLREEEMKQEELDISDIYKRIPILASALKDPEKSKLEAYLIERVQTESVKCMWKRNAKEKEKWLDIKERQLTDAEVFEHERKTASEKISLLENEIQQTQDIIVEARTEKRSLERLVAEMQIKHRETMNIQIKYNTANDGALQRSAEKMAKMEAMLKSIHSGIRKMIKMKVRDSERELMFISENEFAFLLDDFDDFVREFKDLSGIKKLYETLLDEQCLMMHHLGYAPEKEETPTLLIAFRDFAVKNDENITQLRREISKYGDHMKDSDDNEEDTEDQDAKEQEAKAEEAKAEDAKAEAARKEKEAAEKAEKEENAIRQSKLASGAAVWQAAIMSVMRKQLNDLKVDARKKTTQISMQEDDIVKLKAKLKALERQLEKANDRVREVELISERRMSVNGRLSGGSLESVDGKVAEAAGKHTLFPPIRFGQIEPPKAYSPIPKNIRKHHASIQKPFNVEGTRISSAMNEGFTTAPVRLVENRGRNPGGSSNVLGDLKSLHNRHRTSAYHDRTNMKVIGREGTPRHGQAKVRS